MKKLISVSVIFFLLSNSPFSINQPVHAQPLPTTYQPFGPFECLKEETATSLCPYVFLETVICELDNTNCLFDPISREQTFQRIKFLLNYWNYIITNSHHTFNSPIMDANLSYFNGLSPYDQSQIYALTICHINSEACYVNNRGEFTIYQPDEIICRFIDGVERCRRPSDGAICQISPQACGGTPD